MNDVKYPLPGTSISSFSCVHIYYIINISNNAVDCRSIVMYYTRVGNPINITFVKDMHENRP